MNAEQKGVLDRASERADGCRRDAELFRRAAEAMRAYAYFGDEYGDAAEDAVAVECYQAMRKAAEIATASARKINEQMRELPGYADWVGDPLGEIRKSLGIPDEDETIR